MPVDVIDQFLKNKNQLLFYPRIPTMVSAVEKNSNAEKAGLMKKDLLKEINGFNIKYFDQFSKELDSLKGEKISLLVNRDGKDLMLNATVGSNGKLGFMPANFSIDQLEGLGYYNLESSNYTFLGSFPAGYNKAFKKLGSYIDQFALILKPSSGAYKGMGGFGAIGSMFPPSWDWEIFWNLTAFLSLMLAFMNILPIPALDGGHVVFLVYEMIVGKPAPEKIMEYAQTVGMLLLLSLLIFANGNDILKLF